MVYHKIVKNRAQDVFTFTEQYKNISGFVNILKVVEIQDTTVRR